MEKVKVSIIIPVFNLEAYLETCLQSLVGQTLTQIEIICIDDGSDDGSPEILERFASQDKRILVKHIANSGAGIARNIGMELARGEFIAFVDGDDMVMETMFEKLYKAAIKNNSEIAMCNPDCFDTKTGKNSEPYYFKNVRKRLYNLESETVLGHEKIIQLLAYIPVVPWNKIYKRGLLERSGARFAEHLKHEDFLFFFQVVLNANSITYLKEKLYRYRVNRQGSITHKPVNAAFADVPKVFEMIENSIGEHLRKKHVSNNYQAFKTIHIISWVYMLLNNGSMDKEEKLVHFMALRSEIKSFSGFSLLSPIDKMQYLLIRKKMLNIFRFKIRLDNFSSAIRSLSKNLS